MAKKNTNKTASKSVTAKKTVNKGTSVEPTDATETVIFTKAALRRYLAIGLVVLAVIIGLLVWQTIDAKQDAKKLSDPKNFNQRANADLIKDVENILVVPQNEQPQIADVTDKDKLKERPFFAAAENGDKVLLYQESSYAVIYRPSEKKIVNVASIEADKASPAAPAAPAQ